MGIIDDIKAAEIDASCEFSQEEWEDALIYSWMTDGTLSGAIAKASNYSGLITTKLWDALFARARTLKPSLSEFTSGRNRTRVWIAQNAAFANSALYEGDFIKAKKLLSKGGKSASGRRMVIKETKSLMNKDNSVIYVGGRNSDKRHDWGTCK